MAYSFCEHYILAWGGNSYNNQMRIVRVEVGLLLLLLLVLETVAAAQVDSLNILLPQQHSSSRLPLQLITAEGGCYSWSSSAPEIITASMLEPTAASCSKRAVAEVVQPGAHYSTISIVALEQTSQSSLLIPVRIRPLSRLSIVTKSRMMNIRELQKLEITGYDAEQNTFTSLEGLRFRWRLEQDGKIITKVPLTQAQLYLPLRTRQLLEGQGFQSDLLVVRAIAPGNLTVHVSCSENGYEHLTDSITLSVHERFELRPGPVLRLLPESLFQLHLAAPSGERIVLPHSYYSIETCESFKINSTLYLQAPAEPQECKITVSDTRTIPAFSSSVRVIVAYPHKMKILTDPNLIVGVPSAFQVRCLSQQGEEILGESRKLTIQSRFAINKQLKTLTASTKSNGKIKASLGELRAELQLESFLQVRPLLPADYIHLPVDQRFQLKVLGGSGSYDFSLAHEIGDIKNKGVISCRQPGETTLTVSDRRDPKNKASIRLKASPIHSIRDLEEQKEVNKDQWGNFYIIGRSPTGETFSQCRESKFALNVPYKIEIEKKVNFTDSLRFLAGHDSKLVRQTLAQTSLLKGRLQELVSSFSLYTRFNQIEQSQLRRELMSLENYGICDVIRFRSLLPFESTVQVELQGGAAFIAASLPIRVYDPILTMIDGDSTQFLLTPLSSLSWKYQGGSFPWPASQTYASINGKRLDSGLPIIQCGKAQAEKTAYELVLSNIQTKMLLFPAAQSSSISVSCKFPSRLDLSLENGDIFEEIYLTPDVEVRGRVWPVDNQGNHYFNCSNIVYVYSALSGEILGSDTSFQYKAKGSHDQITISTDRLKEATPFKRVALNFKVSVVQPIQVQHQLAEPDQDVPASDFRKHIKIIAPFTPKKPYIMNLTYDNSFLQLRCNESVSCSKLPNAVSVNLNSLGRGLVSIKDRRAYGSTEWIFEFEIVEADEVRVLGFPSSIPEGENFNVTILNLFKGTTISPLLYEANHLHLVLPKHLKVIAQHGNRFLVNAGKVGVYDIHGQLDYPRTVTSKLPFQLAVYERIEPDFSSFTYAKTDRLAVIRGEANVIIGCQRLLNIKGGPRLLVVTAVCDPSLVVTALSSRTFSIIGKKEGTFELVFSISHQAQQIAQMSVVVIVSNIQSVELASIDEPIVGAQFRILPRFKIGQKAVEGCICDFDYSWSAERGRVRLGTSASMGFLVAGGVNATALAIGTETITLRISNKADNMIISSIKKHLQVKRQINLQIPTVIEGALQHSETIRIAPATTYEFLTALNIEVQGFSLKKNSSNSLTAISTGLSTVKLFAQGFHSEVFMVQSVTIQGIFIQNDGVVILQPNSKERIPIYLYDNHGRLFVTPLKGLQIRVESSSPHILKASLSDDQSYVEVEGLLLGSCTLIVTTRNAYDAVSVSVGSQLIPSSEARVLKGGKVYYHAPTGSSAAWSSSNPGVVAIDSKTGIASANQAGKVKISNGDLAGWLEVVELAQVEQHSFKILSKGVYEVVYKGNWETKSGLEELPSFSAHSEIDNNFFPYCLTENKKWFNIRSQIRQIEGRDRLVCNAISLLPFDSKDFPMVLSITVHDNSEKTLARFNYPSKSGFYFDESKSSIILTPLKPRHTIDIHTTQEVNLTPEGGRHEWLSSSYSAADRLQTVIIDMGGVSDQQVWELQVSTPYQKEKISVTFSKAQKEEKQELNFFSFSFDWPEYLIMLMAIVFGLLCIAQYLSEEKYKNS